ILGTQNGFVAIRDVSGSPSMSTSLKPLGLAVALVLAGCNQAAAPADSASAADMADAAAVETMAEARSEEHTSELPSLMRISYAVFCLKKNKIQTISKVK